MSEKLLREKLDNGVLILTLNRPECLNAIDRELEMAFVSALDHAAEDKAVRAIVVTGAGERGFSAGYDVREMSAWSADKLRLEQVRQNWAWLSISRFPKPLITANHGVTMGWGAITSVSADIRIGADNTIFQFTAAPHGVANLTWNLPELVGWSKAKEYLMTSCRIDADEARRSGLLNRVVPRHQLMEEALAVASTIASYPPEGVCTIKRLFDDGLGKSRESRLLAEMNAAQHLLVSTGQLVEESYREFIAARDTDH
jgi:enoyl-CoA hydratase/carnithine racemase